MPEVPQNTSAAEDSSEDRFRLLCEASAAGIFIYQGVRNVYANAAAEALTGYTRQALLAMRFWEMIHPDFRKLVQDRGQARQQGDAVPRRYRVKILTCQGTVRWLDYTGARIQFEGQQAVLGTAFDVTEQVEAEQALAHQKEQLAVTLEHVSTGVLSVDQSGCVAFLNHAGARILGIEGDACGRPAQDILRLFDERTGQAVPDPLADALQRAELITFQRPAVLRTGSGAERLLTCRAGPIRDRQGEVAGAVLAFEDVTTRRRLEEEAFKTEKLESLGVLAGGLAHDFNNLLCVIEGNLSLAGHCLALGHDLADPLSQALLACERSRGLTQQLLTFARGGRPDLSPISLSALLRSTVQFSLRGSAVEAEMQTEPGLWHVEADETQLGQVFHNLALNAVQAMPRGGRLWVRAVNLELDEAGSLPEGRYVRVELEDEGPGVAPELRSRIFDPFFTTKPQGSGLGLPMVHSIVQKHGGRIELRSRPARGACFEILLPAASRPLARPVPKSAPPGAEGGRVLVMDDREAVRKLLVSMLGYLGFESEAAADGAAALELFRSAQRAQRPFDLAILDLTVPGGMGGEETMQQIRRLDPACPGIVASGYSSGPCLNDYQSMGFAAALKKPFRLEELHSVVDRALARRTKRDRLADEEDLLSPGPVAVE